MLLEELTESHGVCLAYFDNDLWPRPGIYIDKIQVIFVNKSLSEDAKRRVVYHELGHLDHDSSQYKRRHEQFELQANKTMIRYLMEDAVSQLDDIRDFNYVQFMKLNDLHTVADEVMVVDEYYRLVKAM